MSKNSDGTTNFADIAPAQYTEWCTPAAQLVPVHAYFGGQIPLDPASNPQNPTGARRFFTPVEDGLSREWSKAGNFLNPPFGGPERPMPKWLAKLHEQVLKGRTVIALLPAGTRFSTKYWQRDALNERLNAWCILKKRVRFLKDGVPQTKNPFDSAYYGYNVNQELFAELFPSMGKVYLLTARGHQTV